MKYHSKTISVLLLALMLLEGAASVAGQELWHVINADRYRRMSQFERVQYDKAFNLLRSNQFRAAASEFDRFQTQYKESEVLPYMVFLRAYALHQAKDRNRAIGVYNEVVDFYPGEIDAAAPALYYRGVAQFDNGDYSKGMLTMKELLDDPDYSKHKVAASASLQLVRNYWRNKEPEKAEHYLKQIYKNHRGNSAADNAKLFYMASCASTGKMADYTSWYLATYRDEAMEKNIKASELRCNMVNEMFDLIMVHHMYYHYFTKEDLILRYRGGKKGPDPHRELWTLIEDNKKFYERAERMWDYHSRSIHVLAAKRFVKDAEFDKRVADALNYVLKTPDDEKNKDRQQKRIARLVELLFQCNRWEHGAYVNNRIKDEKIRAWNQYRSLEGLRKWDDALTQLDTISNKFGTDVKLVNRAGWNKAWILQHAKKEYDEAIKVYRAIGEPPRTLWEVAECQKKKKDSKAAIQTYIEIENSFQDEAGPEAAWRRATYYKQLGNNKMAIAEAKRILKVYPKKQQASWSHQLLESMGIDDTGLGASVDDDDI